MVKVHVGSETERREGGRREGGREERGREEAAAAGEERRSKGSKGKKK